MANMRGSDAHCRTNAGVLGPRQRANAALRTRIAGDVNYSLIKQFIQFAMVGGLGTVTNLAIFFVLVDILDNGPMIGAVASFAVAVTQNYVINELWTFNHSGHSKVSRQRFAKFVFFSSLALGVNLVVLKILLLKFEFPYYVIPQSVGIAAATLINYGTSRVITFKADES
jgi:putative flippase GtrA